MPRSIAIIGGGIIGSCTAYYLSRHPKVGSDSVIRIFEGSSIAAGASGKAGGFLAKDWHRHPTTSLGALSYKLHEELAKEHDGFNKWGYRKVTTLSLDVQTNRRNKEVRGVDWLSQVSDIEVIGDPKSTAQVHPREFTRTIAKLAEATGLVQVTIANVEQLQQNDDGTFDVVAVKYSEQDNTAQESISFTATDVVFAAGPWTGQLAKKLLGPNAGAAATIIPSSCTTSIVIRPEFDANTQPITAHCLFTSLLLGSGHHASPEIYPRPDGTVYLCGEDRDIESDPPDGTDDPGSAAPLPKFARQVRHSPSIAQYLLKLAGFVSPTHLSTSETDITVEAEQACFRPDSSRTGTPIIGQLETKGLWVASGHQVWGINNGPGTGKVLAELILEGKATSADIGGLRPDKV